MLLGLGSQAPGCERRRLWSKPPAVFVTTSCADHPTRGTCLWLPGLQAGLWDGFSGALGVGSR